MSQAGDIYLGQLGQEIKLTSYGRKLTEKNIEITREERTASGRLVIEVIKVKKAFTINYEIIEGPDLEMILGLYDLRKELSLIIYNQNGTPKSYTVWLRPFDRTRLTHLGNGLWEGITLELEEV